MQHTEPQVTTQLGYQLPEPTRTDRRERDTAHRSGPYERSYELRRGYESPAVAARPRAELAQ